MTRMEGLTWEEEKGVEFEYSQQDGVKGEVHIISVLWYYLLDEKLEESVITRMLKHLTFNNFFRKQMKNDYCRRYLGKQTTEK